MSYFIDGIIYRILMDIPSMSSLVAINIYILVMKTLKTSYLLLTVSQNYFMIFTVFIKVNFELIYNA